jgi:hypothetical protein
MVLSYLAPAPFAPEDLALAVEIVDHLLLFRHSNREGFVEGTVMVVTPARHFIDKVTMTLV